MEAIRVGLFTEVFRPVRNGVVTSVDALAEGLSARDIDVTCVAPFDPRATGDRAYVRRVPSLPLPTRTGYRLVLPFAPFDPSRTIVHAHSLFVTGEMALRAARRGGAPLIFSYHTRLGEYAHYAPFDARATRAALETMTRRFCERAAVVVVPTRTIGDELGRIGVRARIEVVPTGVDVARIAGRRRNAGLRASFGAREGDALVLWAGRLGHEKNVSLALATFARAELAFARFVVAGDGVLRARLERLARELGTGARTTFAGEVAPEAMAELYAAADALLFTSTTETQGLVLTEARAAGLPIVAVDTPVTREVAGDRARLAGADPAALARLLCEAMAGPRSPAGADASLDHARTVDAMLAVYSSVAGQTGRRGV